MSSLWRVGDDVAPLLPGLREVPLDEGMAMTDPRWQTVQDGLPYSREDAEDLQMPRTLAAYAALDSLEGEMARLREALEWYAQSDQSLDGGYRARAALGGGE